LVIGDEKGEKDFQPDIADDRILLQFETIKRNKDFEKLRKKGKLLKNKYLVLYILPHKDRHSLRAGFGISKKTGKAFQRNKIRRILKEILRKVSIPYAIDIFIIARYNINSAGYSEIKDELEKSLEKFFLNS